jgi:Outer membrane lipoprotein-sorting protein
MRLSIVFLTSILVVWLPARGNAELAAATLSQAQLNDILRGVDDRQRAQGDWRSMNYIEQKEKGKVALVYEAEVFRRSAEARFMMLFKKPKSSAGQGYLRVDKNLWFYDPAVGKWERRTERERIGGTNSRRSDFDESHLADEYDAEIVGEGDLGAHRTLIIKLTGKPGIDLAFPQIKMWLDKSTMNVLKRQEFALSGRLLRTSYYPKWKTVYSAARARDVWYAAEIRVFDEMEKDNSTVIMVESVDLRSFEANLFTKAWLESKAR